VGEFWLPAGIAIGADNRIAVADSYNCRVQIFRYLGDE
jgi:NHL repeat